MKNHACPDFARPMGVDSKYLQGGGILNLYEWSKNRKESGSRGYPTWISTKDPERKEMMEKVSEFVVERVAWRQAWSKRNGEGGEVRLLEL